MGASVSPREGRSLDALRPVAFERHYTRYAEGAVLAVFGETRVLCTATVEEKVPAFLRGTDQGWVTAEYAMLPRSTDRRTQRAVRTGVSGRSAEIQRLIGRALRLSVDLKALGPRTLMIDCDVLQADGGTRVASVNGGYVALVDALRTLRDGGAFGFGALPLLSCVSAVSAGIVGGAACLDLDSAEDRAASADFNVVADHADRFVEIQGTGEEAPFSRVEADRIFDLCLKGCREIRERQLAALELTAAERAPLAF